MPFVRNKIKHNKENLHMIEMKKENERQQKDIDQLKKK